MKKEVITSRMLLDNGWKSNEAQDIKEEYDLSDEELSILIKGMENIEMAESTTSYIKQNL